MKGEKIKKFFSSKAARSAILVTAVMLIALAVYLNYRWFYDPIGSLGYGDNNMDNANDGSQQTGADAGTNADYFSATALARKQSRDEAIEVLKLVTSSDEASAEAKAEASAKISGIAADMQNEANIESLVKAKGFTDCIAVISENSASVIVKADDLKANECAQILTIVYETAGILPENVSIINK